LPTVLHPLGGQPLIAYSVATPAEVTGAPPVLVVGPESDDVRAALAGRARFAVQPRPLGTADAVRAANSALQGAATDILVTYADMPLLRVETLRALAAAQAAN